MEATKKLNGKAVGKWLSNNAIIIMMLAVTLIVGIIHPNFFSGTNMINLFKNVSIRYIIALGISGCLITTGNDLSAGRLAGFAACLACIFAQTEGASGKFYPNMPTLSTPVVFILVIAICAVIGLCNGLVVSYLKVQPFIATLGMQQVVYGICLVYTGGTPIGSLNSNFTALAKDTFLAVPVLIWIALIVAVCFWFLYNKTRHGKYMYAIGGNEAAAEVAGVNVNATKIRIYILASCMYALGGFLVGAKAERHPELVRRIAAEGHDTGIHTWEHAAGFPMRSSWAMTADILRCRESLRQIAGVETHLFRPPFGVTNPMVARAVKRTQSRCIGWSVRSFDTLLRRSREAVAERIARRLGDGKVILLHDDRPGADRLLRLVLDDLKRRGYGTATVCELFKIEKP